MTPTTCVTTHVSCSSTRRPKGLRAPDAREVTLPRTGHMFRFSHPVTYATAVEDFLAALPTDRQGARA